MPTIEKMDEFFASRIDTYEEHMLKEVEGCREGYRKMAELLPKEISYLLDLGCGTGLELDAILSRIPDVAVTAIDLSGTMLARMKSKHPEAAICPLRADFAKINLSRVPFYGAAVSFESMHHLTAEEKLPLYEAIHTALRPGGIYIECDYMAKDEDEATRLLQTAAAARAEAGIPEGERCHLDIPCTKERQRELLLAAGFAEVDEVFSEGQTVMLLAKKA